MIQRYELYDADGNVIYKGSAYNCAIFMNWDIDYFYKVLWLTSIGKRNGSKGAIMARKVE